MAYDEKLADRIRRALGPQDDIEERKMFGGIAFLRAGRMFVGITGEDLMVRVGPERRTRRPIVAMPGATPRLYGESEDFCKAQESIVVLRTRTTRGASGPYARHRSSGWIVIRAN